jgi:pimeloyl-ACP methyl ester carboxylesterase
MVKPCPRKTRRALAVALLALACSAAPLARAESIDEAETIAVDGAELYLLVRGDDARAPAFLWLHGGPGGAERPLFRAFNGELERSFVVAYLDQRGAGRSFDADADPRALTVARHLADLDAVVDHLRARLAREKLALVGHSWGGALGLLYTRAHPEKVSVVVAVAPLVSTLAAQREQYEFVQAEATLAGDAAVLERLREIGAPPHTSAERVLAMERLADRYGAVWHRRPSQTWTLLRGLFGGLVTPWEIPTLIRANRVSLEAMNDELLELDLARSVPSVDVPVVFLLGRWDRHVSARVASDYLDALVAPAKTRVWLEESAHNPPFEQPERFNELLRNTIR